MQKILSATPLKWQLSILIALPTLISVGLLILFFTQQWHELSSVTQLITGAVIAITFPLFLVISTRTVLQLGAGLTLLSDSLKRGYEGDFSTRITGSKNSSEMKEIYRLTNNFMDQIDVFAREASSVMEAISKEQYYRKILTKGFKGEFLISSQKINSAANMAETKSTELIQMMKQLDESVKSVLNDTSTLTTNLKNVSTHMLDISNESVVKSTDVENAATTSQENTGSMSAAVEELSSSIKEIASQTARALQVTSEAQREMDSVANLAIGFGKDVENISSVVELIQAIAEQINLLALNATIESARAGEAGKGFAVVASEVKDLASQTAKATEDIGKQIESVQNSSKSVLSGIQSINTVITNISEISNSISAAIEEQSSVTQEISSNMSHTSKNVTDVRDNIVTIKTTLEETASSASNVLSMTDNLTNNVTLLGTALDNVMHKKVS